MNYAHNNARLKKLQFRIEKTLNFLNSVWSFLTPSKQEVELQVIDKSLPQLPEKC